MELLKYAKRLFCTEDTPKQTDDKDKVMTKKEEAPPTLALPEPPKKEYPSTVAAPSTTTYQGGGAKIEVKKEMIVEDNSELGSIFPSLFYLTLSKDTVSSIGFARRAMRLAAVKCPKVKGTYTVIPAPTPSTVKTSAKVMSGLTARAVFIARGDNSLLYRIEAVKQSSSDPDMLEEEFCTYDISNTLAYYVSDLAVAASFY